MTLIKKQLFSSAKGLLLKNKEKRVILTIVSFSENAISGSQQWTRKILYLTLNATRVKLSGKWVYFYRALDKEGNTIDFLLISRRDTQAARGVFKKAFKTHSLPTKFSIAKSGANKRALGSLNSELSEENHYEIRQVKYLNNIVEQDHRFIKKRIRPTLGGL